MRPAAGLLACLSPFLPALAQPAPAGPGTLVAPPAATSDPVPYDFQRLVVRKRADSPPYPPLARFANLEGEVLLRLTISRSGWVERAEALEGPRLLREAAAAYLQAWTFQPVVIDGTPLRVRCDLRVPFHLDAAPGAPHPSAPPSKVVVEVAQNSTDGPAVLEADRLEAELGRFLDRSGLTRVAPLEAGPQDAFHLGLQIQVVRAEGLAICQVRARCSLWEDRDLTENVAGKPPRIAFFNRVAGQKGDAGLQDLVAGVLRQGLDEVLAPPAPIREIRPAAKPSAPAPASTAPAQKAGGVVDFDFSQIRVKRQPPAPPYPPAAKLARVQGTVVLDLIIDPQGEPVQAEAREGPVPLLFTAISYSLAWRFEPAKLNGVPQYARFRLTMPFRLR
ncbi:energy transducer TonB [Geothrix alkalitolerans]|uniref:energy transducer TonB n=1 Tax=Geothrix alkalitolerans TaxID=2922724 RepID=UPI001FAF5205|nr:energy transducer TonB [Geothrix alkalitolerans]